MNRHPVGFLELGRPSEFSWATRYGMLEASVDAFLAGRITKNNLRSEREQLRWIETAANVSFACYLASAAERRRSA